MTHHSLRKTPVYSIRAIWPIFNTLLISTTPLTIIRVRLDLRVLYNKNDLFIIHENDDINENQVVEWRWQMDGICWFLSLGISWNIYFGNDVTLHIINKKHQNKSSICRTHSTSFRTPSISWIWCALSLFGAVTVLNTFFLLLLLRRKLIKMTKIAV